MGKLRDYFKSFLGMTQEPLAPNELPRDIEEDLQRRFGHNFESREWQDHPTNEWHFDLGEPDHEDVMVLEGGDTLKEMESMFENFFKGFPFSFQSPPDNFYDPRLGIGTSPEEKTSSQDQQNQGTPQEPGSLRDKMLKQPDSDSYQEFDYQDEGHNHNVPGFGLHSWFGGLWKAPFRQITQPDEKVDKDLDSEIESGNQSLDEILSPKPSESIKPVTPRSSSSSSSFSHVTTIDSSGRTESRTTRKDSSGREEVTITRKIGDQEHTIKNWRNEDGSESCEEKIVNIDKDEISEFDQKWNQLRQGKPSPNKDSDTANQQPFSITSIYDNILEQFFPRRR